MELKHLQSEQHSGLCPLCFTEFRDARLKMFSGDQDPRALDCDHVCCRGCLDSWQKSGGGGLGWVGCPVCWKKTPVSKWTGVRALQKYAVPSSHKAEVYRAVVMKGRHDDQRCTACSSEQLAAVYCTQCAEHLCESCLGKHGEIPAFSSHGVTSVKTMYTEPKRLHCRMHDRPLEYQCRTCREIVCHKCVMTSHDTHKTESLEVTLGPIRARLEEELQEFGRELSAHVHEPDHTVQSAMEVLTETETKIKDTCQTYVNQIREAEARLMKLVSAHKAELAQPVKTETLYNFQIDVINKLGSFCSKTLKETDPFRVLQVQSLVQKRLTAQTRYCRDVLEIVRPQVRASEISVVKFSPTLKIDNIGDLIPYNLAVLLMKKGQMEAPYLPDSNDKWKPDVIDSDIRVSDVNIPTVQNLWCSDMWGFPRRQFRPLTSVACMFSGHVVVTEENESRACRLHLLSPEGAHLRAYDHQALQAAAVDDDTFAFTDWDHKCVTIVSLATNQIVRQWGHGQFVDPLAITYTDEERWVITDDFTKTVHIHDRSGKNIRSFGRAGRKHDEFLTPHYVTFDPVHRGRIIVSDPHNDAVKVFDNSGKFLTQIWSREPSNKDGQLHNPCGVAVDQQGQIVVADSLNDRVSLYSADGSFVQHLLGGAVGVRRPVGMHIEPFRSKMAVTHTPLSNTLALYRLVY